LGERRRGDMGTLTGSFRVEKDSMGEVKLPSQAYYGAQTQRAVENFSVSGWRLDHEFVHALGFIKHAAAKINHELGLLDRKRARAIRKAAEEVFQGRWDDQFVVDVFQTGSGTSTNMNANEVIANRANEILGGKKGVYRPVHPNDHVNLGQSSNDVFPSVIHISSVNLLRKDLLQALKSLERVLRKKSQEFDSILKIGRTHLQDATPVRLGQEFGGYARQVERSIDRIGKAMDSLCWLPLGGTAVGTGMNTHPLFARKVITEVNAWTGWRFREAADHFEAQGTRDASVELSGALKSTAVSLTKIANDIRWLGSGPRCGIAEIRLPETQPGSSIMPGKVNPVIPESLIQVCAHVIGSDLTTTLGGLGSFFELNLMMPLIAHHALQSIRLLSNGVNNFVSRCAEGLAADRERCEEMIERSLALVTALVPRIGYDEAARIAKRAFEGRKTIRQVVEEERLFSGKDLDRLFNVEAMTGPSKRRNKKR
jgi:fumarate hydratase, class II